MSSNVEDFVLGDVVWVFAEAVFGIVEGVVSSKGKAETLTCGTIVGSLEVKRGDVDKVVFLRLESGTEVSIGKDIRIVHKRTDMG